MKFKFFFGVGAIFLVGVFALGIAQANSLDTVVVPPATARAGEIAEFSVYVHNAGSQDESIVLPAQVACRIEPVSQVNRPDQSGPANRTTKVVEVNATALSSITELSQTVVQGGFARVKYALMVPESSQGPIRLIIADYAPAGVMFSVAQMEPPPAKPSPVLPPEFLEDDTLDSLAPLYKPYLANLSFHEPTYFLVGTDPKESKFQISFKYRFFNPEGELVSFLPPLKGVHLGYTQTSFWDLASSSAPFEGTSYKPELFYLSSNIPFRPAWMDKFFLQAGFQHESNGKDGDASRSTNFLYLKPKVIWYDEASHFGLEIAPKVWVYVQNSESTNPDLPDYRGYFDLEMKVGKADSFVLGSNLRWAKEGGSIQLDLTYPLHRTMFKNLPFYLHLQYVNSLAEGLLHYQERTEAWRIGFSIVR